MGRRKGRKSETLKSQRGRREDDGGRLNRLEMGEKPSFFACYLLTSLCPGYKGRTYIGFTVNPRRRIRQHNGELRSGALRTKSKRPWELVLCIYGFPTNVAALQFEWAWQHPVESLAVRKAAAAFKSLGGLAKKIKLAYTMLTLPAWKNLNLTVNFFSTKYTNHYAGGPSLPSHMSVMVQSMDELPCYTRDNDNVSKFENDLWDHDEELNTTGGSYELEETRSDDLMMPVLDSADNMKNNDEPSCSINSPKEATFPSANNYCSVPTPVTEEENGKTDCPRESADKDEPRTKICRSSGDVEVIDLVTPSPEYRLGSQRKKRGFSARCPPIIDLTKSPVFVQL